MPADDYSTGEPGVLPTGLKAAGVAVGLAAGPVFAFVVGSISSHQYVLDSVSLVMVELPFVVLFAVLARRIGWRNVLVFTVVGALASWLMMGMARSLTPVVFLKTSLAGMVIGIPGFPTGRFTHRLLGACIPGMIVAFMVGMPLMVHGVPDEVLRQTRDETLEVYRTFMNENDAQNTVDNAMGLFEGVYRIAAAFLLMLTLLQAWLGFLLAGTVMPRFGSPPEPVPPIERFRMPFHVIWVFIGAAGLWVMGIGAIQAVTVNVLALTAGLFGVQGLAVAVFHMNRMAVRGRLLKVVFWVIFFLTMGLAGVVLIGVGLFDNWFHLRDFPRPTRE